MLCLLLDDAHIGFQLVNHTFYDGLDFIKDNPFIREYFWIPGNMQKAMFL